MEEEVKKGVSPARLRRHDCFECRSSVFLPLFKDIFPLSATAHALRGNFHNSLIRSWVDYSNVVSLHMGGGDIKSRQMRSISLANTKRSTDDK